MISIIVPNFNGEKYVGKCLDSIINQSYKNYEIIIIDDGSTDNSEKIINKYVENNHNILFIKQYNQNASIARNKGIELAKGKYLFFLDSDDELYDKNTLLQLVSNIEKFDIILGNYNIINEDDKIISNYEIPIKSKYDFGDYIYFAPVPSNKLFLKEFIINNKLYFSNVRIGQDLNFYLKALRCTEKIKVIDNIIYNYRITHNSMTRKYNINFLDIYSSLDEVRKFYKRNNDEKRFNEYLIPCCINHFHGELTKIVYFNKVYQKKMIYSYFDFCIKDFTYGIKKNSKIKNELKIYYCKKVLLKTKLYNFVKKIVSRKR